MAPSRILPLIFGNVVANNSQSTPQPKAGGFNPTSLLENIRSKAASLHPSDWITVALVIGALILVGYIVLTCCCQPVLILFKCCCCCCFKLCLCLCPKTNKPKKDDNGNR
ncbi:hypothetical protein BIW11_08419 [Tropilaelaps mercedesae]|uniref:Uncharacterized protein n=1 Tax=Tropilaelaps mercedesae TaxID=418985 RepID=A0A1V9XQ11_9ACAR|nr:hypothetical protein BIW11_08419 [Tropilaelaps mercedesae]